MRRKRRGGDWQGWESSTNVQHLQEGNLRRRFKRDLAPFGGKT
jgi:hypothetical protein